MKGSLLLSAIAVTLVASQAANAGMLESQSNPVANGDIVVVPGNNDRSDWASIPSYAADPSGDGGTIDNTGLQVAHDDTNWFLHLLFAPQGSPQFYGGNHNTLIDIDQDRGTGFYGGGGFIAIGADYLLQGTTLYSFVGATQETWGWSSVAGGLPWDDFPTTDIEVSVPLASLGNPDALDFVLYSTGGTEDWYPNGATGGATGDYFTYSFVPEPTSMLLMLLGLLAPACGRSARV